MLSHDKIADSDPVISYVDQLIYDSMTAQASDIHIEPERDGYRIRLRCHSHLSHFANIPTQTGLRIIAHLKVLSDMNVSERRLPQDGSIHDTEKAINLRLNTLPTIYGEKLAIRLLQSSEKALSLNELGMQPGQLVSFKNILDKPHGLIIITGPTGSGKTMTMYAALKYLNMIDKNIITIENPVEIIISNINQVNIQPESNFTFATALRSILRQDPDIIMLGEIRDQETAHIAIQAALTGHLVLTTLHTKDAISAITRLKSLDVSTEDINASVKLIIAQRLLQLNQETTTRSGIFELLTMTDWLSEALSQDISFQTLKKLLRTKHHATLHDAAKYHNETKKTQRLDNNENTI